MKKFKNIMIRHWMLIILINIISIIDGHRLPFISNKSSIDDNTHNDTADQCTLANFQQCISGLWSGGTESGSGDLAFPTTNEQLQLTCADLKDRVRCLDRHSERCFTHEMMQVFGHIVTNAKQFVHHLCDDKKVQAGMNKLYMV